MIIYGTRAFNRKKGMTREGIACTECGLESCWLFAKQWSWFTLFFIPIFPYWVKTILICPACECGIKVTKENEEEILAMLGDEPSIYHEVETSNQNEE